jgi:hypothetical protein
LPFVASAILRIMRLKYVFYSNYKRLSHQIEYRRSDLFALRQGRSALALGRGRSGRSPIATTEKLRKRAGLTSRRSGRSMV